MDLGEIVFIDAEVDAGEKKILDIGAAYGDGREFHSGSAPAFSDFIKGCKYICGHNILKHDLLYLKEEAASSGAEYFIDTLYMSPLLFPKRPYHHLVKDDKLATGELSNPLNDAKKARDLFFDEQAAYANLDGRLRRIYANLLGGLTEFKDFFRLVASEGEPAGASQSNADKPAHASHGKTPIMVLLHPQDTADLIRETFLSDICANAPVEKLAAEEPAELAYALAQISVIRYDSLTPPWVLKNYPRVKNILHALRNKKCPYCSYCAESMDETKALKRFFHFDSFKSYDGMPLQKTAVKAAVDGKSFLAVFPTGGGKSITFQLPALVAGANEKGLTVVISPLQSLMKDQIDNLESQHNITEAVTINGALDPLERAKAFERVEDGSASILYISPESLRSQSIERLLQKRNVVRFVIDEAHCFSAWGHDFRVDYLYIGDFINSFREKKDYIEDIPVSCFTATAKQRVIADIKNYFRDKLSLELEIYRASAARPNLSYHIFEEENNAEKNHTLRRLLTDDDRPAIIYVSRTRRAEQLAAQLTDAGFPAKPYHGRMDGRLRAANQDAFMNGDVKIIVATTAFGMGVDKKDIGMVIHYDISDSLENYVQEAGRAGRDEKVSADCYILFSEEDLDKHFNLLNQTKLSQKEIQQVWKALKELTRSRAAISQSALEIARMSGWDDSVPEMETRVKTAINALEQSKFIKRGLNMPRIFADSILVKNMEEARAIIDKSARFDDASRQQAIRIMSNLISARSKARGQDEDGETRVDYISDRLGIVKEDVIRVIGLLREERILSDAKDLVAYIRKGEKINHPKHILSVYKGIENFLYGYLDGGEKTYNIKEMNEELQAELPDASINRLNNMLNYFTIKRFVKRTQEYNKNYVTLKPYFTIEEMREKSDKRLRIANYIIDELYPKAIGELDARYGSDVAVGFSVMELKEGYAHNLLDDSADTDEIEDALYYLLKIGAMKIDGGFLVIYNAIRIERLNTSGKQQYRKEHYGQLEEFYKNKRRQIHIVGEYARRLSNDYREAMTFVDDYFVMDYNLFLEKYFEGRHNEIDRNITNKKYRQLFGELSSDQLRIVNDNRSRHIVVAAGPGSGKTKLLTHKLASVYMMEDVKHEQMLMLTFSRAAATEFKKRLLALIGNAANFIQIMTFHSYCFDLLGRVGDIGKSDTIIERTVEKINAGEVDTARLTKSVLVIDEAQDMSAAEFSLVRALMDKNDGLRVIAVGDDDQNIFKFRGSDSANFVSLLNEPGAKKYELVDNFRSDAAIVDFANLFARNISRRLKAKPIIPVLKERGNIGVCKLATDNIAVPAANALLAIKPSGSVCVITRTNEEALNIVGLLLQNGVTARQIQADNDFNLLNLAEIRDFIVGIDAGGSAGAGDSYTVNDEVWQSAKFNLNRKYERSENLPGVLKLIADFEETRGYTIYKSDFKQFIAESHLEDFISKSEGATLVSTIHQTKGREFDNVFLALSRFQRMDDETARAIYVAITRTKKNLYVLYNGAYFDNINIEDIARTSDNAAYAAPGRILMQLSHKDVALGFFAYRRREINALVSGQALALNDTGCLVGDTQVLKYSASFNKKLEDYKSRGYIPAKAAVRHIVHWKDNDKDNESKIILPILELTKS